MEKVTIKSAIDTGRKTKDNKPVIEIELSDGRQGSAFSQEALNWSGEIDLEIKDAGEYKGVKKYYFNLPDNKSKKFTQKDWTFEKRKCSLECAIKASELTAAKIESDMILKIAEKFYDYLNQK
jgi:hypothetical protein